MAPSIDNSKMSYLNGPFYFAQPYLFPAAAQFKVYLVLYI